MTIDELREVVDARRSNWVTISIIAAGALSKSTAAMRRWAILFWKNGLEEALDRLFPQIAWSITLSVAEFGECFRQLISECGPDNIDDEARAVLNGILAAWREQIVSLQRLVDDLPPAQSR
jgi:hypothetical protein